MALKATSLLTSTTVATTPRLAPSENGTKRVTLNKGTAAGTETLPLGFPLAWNTSTKKHVPYTQPSDAAIYTITANGTPASAGTFQLIVDGLVAVFAFDVAAAAIQSALLALFADAGKPYTVAAVATTGTDLGDASAVVTLTFSENAGAPSVQLDASGLTGNAHVLAATDAGTQLNGTNEINGFVYEKNPGEEGVKLDATDDVTAIMMHMGVVYRDDVNTAAIRALIPGSPSEAEVDAALREMMLRNKGLIVRGLTQVP